MKRIVICCDGTWNSLLGAAVPGGQTNVARLYLSVRPRDGAGVEQRVHYLEGVGTGRLQRLRGGAFGFGLSERVQRAYRALVADYEQGDELWFFGFSRGAFTARSLAGLVRTVGVLHPGRGDLVAEAYALYRRRDGGPDTERTRAFRAAHSRWPGRIRFVGVWDTVGALGIPVSPWNPLMLLNRRWRFHDTTLSSLVQDGRHALAIDERRGAFRPALWDRSRRAGPDQRVCQMWFAGVHSDVGGGYPAAGLSQIAFGWMVAEAAAQGLAIDGHLLAATGERPPPWMYERARGLGIAPAAAAAVLGGLAVAPGPLTSPHESLRGAYRFLPRHRRHLPYGARRGHRYPDQEIAPAARALYDADPAYRRRSPALAAYLARGE